MRFVLLLVFALCLFELGHTYCCFRQPSTACGCSESPCMSSCSTCNSCSNSYGCGNTCGCYRDRSNVCNTCQKKSPVCSCMRDCSCDSCIYFPEVEYPATIVEVKPNYYGACWSY